MRYLLVCRFGIILSLCALPTATAPSAIDLPGLLLRAQETMNFTVQGKITKHTPGRLTINTEENILFRVRYDDKADIRKSDGTSGTAKDLRVGLTVRVDGELTEAGEILAQKIEIQKT